MLCSKIKTKLISMGSILLSLVVLSSCLPSSTPSVKSNSQVTDGTTGNNNDTTFKQPTFPHAQNFLQEGSTTTVNSLSVGINFNDSILIRGSALSTYLSKISTSTVMCLVGRYTYVPGKERYLVLSAKPMVFTDVARKTQEHYLLIQPSNDIANQNDCLTYNLQSALQANGSTTTLHFSLQQLCTNCTTSVSSTPLRIFFSTGEEASAISLGSTRLVIAGNSQQTGESCSGNSYCQSIGFNCCLESQCVNNGAIRPSAYTNPGFASAQEEVRENPNSFMRYPEFYFICTDQTGTNPLPPPETPDVDYEATVRLRELQQLHNCLNLVDGEFSYCTVKFINASKRSNKTFSSIDPETGLNFASDVNFTSVNDHLKDPRYINNIVKVIYADEILYDQSLESSLTGGELTTPNDDLETAQQFRLDRINNPNGKDDNLYLTYKVDGTCKRMTSSLAQCTKTYIFESLASDKYKTTYHDSSSVFKLPSYADISETATIKVEVSGIILPEGAGNWRRVPTTEYINGVPVSRPRIVFDKKLYQNQKIKITYYVKDNVDQLVAMKESAQSKINSICQCSGINCNLAPQYSDSTQTNVINYQCIYPSSDNDTPPVNQTVYVSNKNAPHRYYDHNGVNYDEDYQTAPKQDGNAFKYESNDTLKPNNNTCTTGECYIGFNEIYGSFDTNTSRKSLPAKRVRVKKDMSYDIITINGTFSTCPTCGTDYYSSLQKIFPDSFGNFGSGYTPDILNSSRLNSTGALRADDLLFGRACFVPATMIPWTHEIKDTVKDQRNSRLAAQHFLFANGYQRDWYGFDYGSLIGSFDGVTWFSIGSSRRVKAKGNYLYLAVNSYFHDLNTDNSYQVSITESSPFSSPDKPDHDTESDGAQCQRNHFCSKDDDCYRQLGYEYTCQNINEIMTNWPVFDQSGAETINSLYTTLASVVGGSNGQNRRCVYRGRGAPCLGNLSQLDSMSEENIFNGSKTVGHLTCSSNNACTPLSATRFNNRIARFANTPTAQNLQEVVKDGDTVGLGAKILGRPFDYNGKNPVNSQAVTALSRTNITAICTPGVELTLSNSTQDLNFRYSTNPIGKSDKLYGVGPTLTGTNSNWKYLSACPATDESGYSLHQYDVSLTSPLLLTHTTTQNMSSNLLDILPLNQQKIYSSESTTTEDKQIKTIGYQRNACLRAPGASCFTDLECAPSSLIGDKFRSAANLGSYLSQAEINFWKEDLICGNPNFKYVGNNVLNAEFDILENKCCRDVGKTLSVYTQTNTSDFKWCEGNQIQVAGLNTRIDDKDRYSRVHTVYDSMTCNMNDITNAKKFALSIANNGNTPYVDINQILGQYKTLDTLNSRTCCTKNWVRSFAPSNGGGHRFESGKTQTIDKTIFKYISWMPNDTTLDNPPGTINDGPFECDEDNFNNISCEVRNLTPTEQKTYLEWVASLELIGIPQVAVSTNDKVYMLVDEDQKAPISPNEPLPNTIEKMNSLNDADFSDGSSGYYSAANYSKFKMGAGGLKKIFSENEFNCCVPSGTEVPDSVGDAQCCTGYVANVGGPRRCCLPDFTNVTLYLNRYVSSEGRGLPDHAYDEKTGYIKDAATVVNIANQKSLCCSGTAMTGVAISKLPIPIFSNRFLPPNAENTVSRFNYRTDNVDNNEETGLIGSIFDAGVRWNNHVYCVPADFAQ